MTVIVRTSQGKGQNHREMPSVPVADAATHFEVWGELQSWCPDIVATSSVTFRSSGKMIPNPLKSQHIFFVI